MSSQTLDFYPNQKKEVSDDDYTYAMIVLKESYSKIKSSGKVTYADNWNLAVAFSRLNEDKDLVRKNLFLSKQKSPNNFAKCFITLGDREKKWDGYLSENEYNEIYKESENIYRNSRDIKVGNDSSEGERTYDIELISILDLVYKKDIKFRSSVGFKQKKEQRILDEENMKIIDSLYNSYGQYIGESLVGSNRAHIMWQVIQHSNIEFMEKYLPIIMKAYDEENISESMVKLLIDRIFSIKYKSQVYGTQKNIPTTISKNRARELLKSNYDLDFQERNNPFWVGKKI